MAPPDDRAAENFDPPTRRDVATQTTAALVLVTGLWGAVSPGCLTPRSGGTNVAVDVIVGLVVAGIGALALVSRRWFPRLHFTSLVLGVWAVLISAFFLDVKVSAAAPMEWSNTWSGAVLAVVALAELSAIRTWR